MTENTTTRDASMMDDREQTHLRLCDLSIGEKVYDPIHPSALFRVWRKDNPKTGGVLLLLDSVYRQMCFDAKEPGSPYGNNDYELSNVRQWLNAEGQDWYKPQHDHDAPPVKANIYDGDNPYADAPGFLTLFSEGFKAAILPCPVESRDRNGRLRILNDLVFLPSATEMGFPVAEGMEEGEKLPLADNPRMRIAAPTEAAVEHADWKPDHFGTDKPWYWWLRSPNASSADYVRLVNTDGGALNDHAYSGYDGVRPALILKSDILVSFRPGDNCARKLLV